MLEVASPAAAIRVVILSVWIFECAGGWFGGRFSQIDYHAGNSAVHEPQFEFYNHLRLLIRLVPIGTFALGAYPGPFFVVSW